MKLSRAARAVASAAVLALFVVVGGRARAGVSIDDLCRAVVEDPSYKVRVSAALTLGKVGGPAAVPALVKALADQNNSVRGIAAQSLGKIGDGAAAEPLQDLLRSEGDSFVKSQATAALALRLERRRQQARPRSTWRSGRSRAASSRRAPRPRRSSPTRCRASSASCRRDALTLSAADQHNFPQDRSPGLLHRRQHHAPRRRGRRAALGDLVRRQGHGGPLAARRASSAGPTRARACSRDRGRATRRARGRTASRRRPASWPKTWEISSKSQGG